MATQTKYQKMLEGRDHRSRKALLRIKAILYAVKDKVTKEDREAIQPALNILEQIKEK